ncbi:MAG TPA: CDP-glycerol glycerophosphotransferase family protein, partial [Sphingobacteriaceae bacterium]
MEGNTFIDFLLNSWIGNGVISIFKFINGLIPKKDDQILFESVPDFSDNPLQLYNYIKSSNTSYKPLWVVDEIREDFKVPQYKRNTLGELWQFLRSKYIVTSHGYHLFLKGKNQVYVNLWHGMPLKTMGYAENNPQILPPKSDDDNYYLIATSTIMRNALAA